MQACVHAAVPKAAAYHARYLLNCLLSGSEEYRTKNAAECVIDKECPNECECEGTVINCSGRRLTQLPREFPSYATEM
jgi:Leucine rich repeat N-terminal domain